MNWMDKHNLNGNERALVEGMNEKEGVRLLNTCTAIMRVASQL